MKVSSLNRYKGKTVHVGYYTEDKKYVTTQGILEDVELDNITLEEEFGLLRIPLKSIYSIHEMETEKASEVTEYEDTVIGGVVATVPKEK